MMNAWMSSVSTTASDHGGSPFFALRSSRLARSFPISSRGRRSGMVSPPCVPLTLEYEATRSQPRGSAHGRRVVPGARDPSRVARRWDEGLEVALECLGKAEAGEVPVLRADDLDAHGQSSRREPARGGGRGKIRRARVSGPEQVIGDGNAATVHQQRAFVALALVVVGKRRAAGHGTQEEIVTGEELGPGEAHAMAGLVGGEPVAM